MKSMSGLLLSLALLVTLFCAASPCQIQAPFFAMTAASSNDLPKVNFGTIGHPATLAWTAIEGGGRGVYNFNGIDKFVKGAPKDANGVANIDLTLGFTPGWAVADHTHCMTLYGGVLGCTIPPDNLQDWTDFITALIAHYNGSAAPHVKYYEIWCEADNTRMWSGSIASLVAMAQLAYPVLKQDSNSSVLTPSVIWDNGPSFVASYLQAGGAGYADGVTFHGYTSQTGGKNFKPPVPLPESPASTNASIQVMITTYRQVADSNGMLGKPLYETEGSWGVNGVIDPDMQAAWVAHYVIVQAGLAVSANLGFANWFAWGVNQPSGDIETVQGTPTQAGYAYSEVYDWLVGQKVSPCKSQKFIWSCRVGSGLVVWNSSQTCSNGVCTTLPYTPAAGYSKYYDLTGALFTINGTVPLGVKPLLLEP